LVPPAGWRLLPARGRGFPVPSSWQDRYPRALTIAARLPRPVRRRRRVGARRRGYGQRPTGPASGPVGQAVGGPVVRDPVLALGCHPEPGGAATGSGLRGRVLPARSGWTAGGDRLVGL